MAYQSQSECGLFRRAVWSFSVVVHHTTMSFKIFLAHEYTIALIALIRCCRNMNLSLMPQEKRTQSEGVITDSALIRLLSGMNSPMFGHGRACSKPPRTMFALERLLSRVNTSVNGEGTFSREPFMTLFTLEQFSLKMCILVLLEVGFNGEGLTTLFTLERSLSRMGAHMVLQCITHCEAFRADTAPVRTAFIMHVLVHILRLHRHKPTFTLAAFVGRV